MDRQSFPITPGLDRPGYFLDAEEGEHAEPHELREWLSPRLAGLPALR
jgi:hypothetical protein